MVGRANISVSRANLLVDRTNILAGGTNIFIGRANVLVGRTNVMVGAKCPSYRQYRKSAVFEQSRTSGGGIINQLQSLNTTLLDVGENRFIHTI